MYITTGEAAKMCGVQLNTIKNWIRSGNVSAIRTPGGHWRLPRSEFLAFMRRFGMSVGDAEPGNNTSHKCILVIDDDVAVHELVAGALEVDCVDYQIYSAYDGYSGLIEIGRLRPELIVLDIMMPDINGLEIIHRLKAPDSPFPKVKIVAITAASDRRLVVNRIREAAPEALLFKPLNLAALSNTVRSIIENPRQKEIMDHGAGI